MTEQIELIMYGTTWCGQTRRARSLLDRNNIPYKWIDIDIETDARRIVEEINHGYRSVPTIIFPDGSHLTEPSNEELAEKLGLPTP